MYIASRVKVILLCAAVVGAVGYDPFSATVFGAPQKNADGFSKKLVGIWEGTDDDFKDKDGKGGVVTVEFKADGKLKINLGPFDLTGTYKVAKEDGKTLTVDTEVSLAGFPGKGESKSDKKTFSITFENDNTIVMSPTDKKDPKTLKRKK
jgi:hypothetical protein